MHTGDKFLCACLVILCTSVFAQTNLVTRSEGDVDFNIDTALFRLAEPDTLGLEVYILVEVDSLARNENGNSVFSTSIKLIDSDGIAVEEQEWLSEVAYSETRNAVNGTILALTPGDYILRVMITDRENGRIGTAERNISAEPMVFSELELASALIPAAEDSHNPLRKGNIIVFPDVDGYFLLPYESMGYIYAELYSPSETIRIQSRFISPTEQYLFARPWKTLEIPTGISAVGLIDSLDFSVTTTPGLHYVEMAVIINGDTLVSRKPVMIDREVAVITEQYLPGVSGEVFTDELKHLLTGEEKDLFNRMDTEESRVLFYENYWAGRPAWLRQQFEQRCVEADQFSTAFRDGYETDQGRVYIIYGPPDEVNRETMTIDILPHETWIYFEQGGAQFVFLDSDGSSSFNQIFSTVEGEISYYNWQEMLLPVGATGGPGFSYPCCETGEDLPDSGLEH